MSNEIRLTDRTLFIRYDKDQKQEISGFAIVPNRGMYDNNGRETNPVIAEVIAIGRGVPVAVGSFVVLNHNTINDKCFHVEHGSIIPYNKYVLGTLDKNGEIIPTPENIVCERVNPVDSQYESVRLKHFHDTVKVIFAHEHSIIGCKAIIKKWADYEVVYKWQDEIRRRVIVWKEDVIAKIVTMSDMEANIAASSYLS